MQKSFFIFTWFPKDAGVPHLAGEHPPAAAAFQHRPPAVPQLAVISRSGHRGERVGGGDGVQQEEAPPKKVLQNKSFKCGVCVLVLTVS